MRTTPVALRGISAIAVVAAGLTLTACGSQNATAPAADAPAPASASASASAPASPSRSHPSFHFREPYGERGLRHGGFALRTRLGAEAVHGEHGDGDGEFVGQGVSDEPTQDHRGELRHRRRLDQLPDRLPEHRNHLLHPDRLPRCLLHHGAGHPAREGRRPRGGRQERRNPAPERSRGLRRAGHQRSERLLGEGVRAHLGRVPADLPPNQRQQAVVPWQRDECVGPTIQNLRVGPVHTG